MEHPGTSFLQTDLVFHGRYRVVRCINTGGMGAVYEVVDQKTDSRRALKIMLPGVLADPDLRARFEREARITGGIESDHIVRVSDAGIDAETSTPFLVMDLLLGEDLGPHNGHGARSASEVVLLLSQAARALDKTHAAGIVHRDLKPENLFLTTRDDGSPCLKILDFGIAKVVAQSGHGGGSAKARSTRTLGTPTFMAPEQIRGDGDIGPAADIYALGHIAYTLLLGEPYWDQEATESESLFAFFTKVVGGLPEEPIARARRTRGVELPEAFGAWLRKASADRPEDRFESAGLAVQALGEALGVPVASLAPSLPGRSSSAPARTAAESLDSISADTLPAPPLPGSHALPARPPGASRARLPIALVVAVAAAIGTFVLASGRPVPPATATLADAPSSAPRAGAGLPPAPTLASVLPTASPVPEVVPAASVPVPSAGPTAAPVSPTASASASPPIAPAHAGTPRHTGPVAGPPSGTPRPHGLM